MDKLKKFIDTNRDAFDDEKLPEGHFGRFEKKLPVSQRNKKIRLYSWCAVLAAASVMLLLFLKLPGDTIIRKAQQQPMAYEQTPLKVTGDTLKDNKKEADNKQPKQHSPIDKDRDEIKELCLYYNMQMNQVLSQMQVLYKKEQTPGASDLLKESKRILTDNFMFEETVLPTLPSSNIGLYAMTQHYNTSLESLSIMLRQMESMANKEIDQ